jgi:hypothetical protein
MTLLQLLNTANKGYPDGFLENHYDNKTGKLKKSTSGDSLARFIVVELSETFDPEKSDEIQASQAIDMMERAKDDLQGVIEALRERIKG